MEDDLIRLDAEGHHGVYILASPPILNNDIMDKLNAPDMEHNYQLLEVSHIDLRDGFCTQFFDADIIVDCDPLQAAPKGQSVIALLHELFIKNGEAGFAKKYKLVSSYKLDHEVEANLFAKQQDLDQADVEYIKDLFENRYAEYPELFLERFDEYIYSHFYRDNK